MRLWHQNLIHYLPTKQLLVQHRECCALRGKGWGRKHSTVDYVFKKPLSHLYAYHRLVMAEMVRRGITPNINWYSRIYRGKNLECARLSEFGTYVVLGDSIVVYPEHDDTYLRECLLDLKSKGAELVNGVCIEQLLVYLDMVA